MFKLKLLSILPQFIYKRIVKFFLIDNKEDTLTFEEIVVDRSNILDRLFDGETGLYIHYLENCKIYGEYGCGISTVFATNYAQKPTISVDTDNYWTKKVKEIVNLNSSLHISFVNLGNLRGFGRPESYILKENIKKYLNYIWEQNNKPDFVLIDGRFRVATFLTTLMNANEGTIVCFDDYQTRPFYHIVENFEKPIQKNNRQAFFKVNNNYDMKELTYYIDKFEYVFD